jgi:hypothetical protein
MWIIHNFPNWFVGWFVHGLLIVGILATLASFFITVLPILNKYRLPAQIISVLLLAAGVYFKGGYEIEQIWRTKVAALEAKVKVAEEEAKKVNIVVETQVVEKIKYIDKIKWKTKTVIKEVEKVIDAECKVVPEAIEIHNASAENRETNFTGRAK